MTRLTVLLAAVLVPLAAIDAQAQSSPAHPNPAAAYEPLTARGRLDDFVQQNFSAERFGLAVAGIGVTNLWSETPPEWGGGADAYGKRLASDVGRLWIRQGAEAAGAYAIGHDPRYIPCPCRRWWKRAAHAVSQSVLTYDNDGNRVFGYARVGASYAGAMAESQWFPDRYGWKDGLRYGTQSFGWAGAVNIGREFWPDIKGKIGWKKN